MDGKLKIEYNFHNSCRMKENPPQDKKDMSKFEALKELKTANLYHDVMKKRITILKLNNDHNLKKMENQQRKIQQIIELRQDISKEKQNDQFMRKSRTIEVEKKKYSNLEKKEKHKFKMEEIKKSINHIKVQGYDSLCRDKLKNLERIAKDEQVVLERKKTDRSLVREMQKKAQDNINSYLKTKRETICDKTSREKDLLIERRENKQKQLKMASLMEVNMIQRQCESKIAYQETKYKLDSMLGNVHNKFHQLSGSTVKLSGVSKFNK